MFLRITFLCFLSSLAFGQIEQIRPELCGRGEGTVPTLPAISIAVDRSQGTATLYFGDDAAGQSLELPGVVDFVPEVCPLSNSHFVIFGDFVNGMNTIIFDYEKRAVLDHFLGFDPAMSPDQRWIVFRKFYARMHELPISEEYLLYDLTKTAAQNRAPDISLTDSETVGKAIFPAGEKNTLWDSSDLPPDRTHMTGSLTSYWANDSRLVLFGDQVQDRFRVVAVKVNSDGSTEAFERAATTNEVCSIPVSPELAILSMVGATAELGNPGEYDVRIQFAPIPAARCTPKTLELRFPADFKLSKSLPPFEHHYHRKPAVVDQ